MGNSDTNRDEKKEEGTARRQAEYYEMLGRAVAAMVDFLKEERHEKDKR